MATEFSTTEKPATFHVKNVKKKRDQRRPDEPKFSVDGRPGKRTPQLEKDLLAAIETGAPYRIACLACGISDDTFANWRRKDADFARAVEVASGKTALRLLKKIEKNADENFSAAAWMLERRFPESFSRPEIQLGVAMQFNSTTNNTIVITAEQAAHLKERNNLIDKELDEIGKAYEAKRSLENGSGRDQIREVESSLVPNTDSIALPPPAGRTSGWWSQLASGDGSRSISASAAEYVLRVVVTDCVGSARASGLKVSWDNEVPTLSELWSAISETCGEGGWQALIERGAVEKGSAL